MFEGRSANDCCENNPIAAHVDLYKFYLVTVKLWVFPHLFYFPNYFFLKKIPLSALLLSAEHKNF